MTPEVLIRLTGKSGEVANWPTRSELLIGLNDVETAMIADGGPASREICFRREG
jgi:hypothetical protein